MKSVQLNRTFILLHWTDD